MRWNVSRADRTTGASTLKPKAVAYVRELASTQIGKCQDKFWRKLEVLELEVQENFLCALLIHSLTHLHLKTLKYMG